MLEQRLSSLWERGRPAVMGILNVTPDSFSDGGRFLDPGEAIAQGARLLSEGADLLDVGGESTRPGAEGIDTDLERARVLPVIERLMVQYPEALISVDTSKGEVAAAALDAGAVLVNDVTAGADPAMLPLVAARGAGIVLMHMRGKPRSMQEDTSYGDVVAEVHAFLTSRAKAARTAGIAPELTFLDPGIGFGKDVDGNLALLRALGDLAALGHPVVLGASRKAFIGRLTGAPVDRRVPGSLAALVSLAGVRRAVARVHDVKETVQFLSVWAALEGVA